MIQTFTNSAIADQLHLPTASINNAARDILSDTPEYGEAGQLSPVGVMHLLTMLPETMVWDVYSMAGQIIGMRELAEDVSRLIRLGVSRGAIMDGMARTSREIDRTIAHVQEARNHYETLIADGGSMVDGDDDTFIAFVELRKMCIGAVGLFDVLDGAKSFYYCDIDRTVAYNWLCRRGLLSNHGDHFAATPLLVRLGLCETLGNVDFITLDNAADDNVLQLTTFGAYYLLDTLLRRVDQLEAEAVDYKDKHAK